MEPPTSAVFVLKIIDYFGDIDSYELLSAVKNLEKNTGLRVYSWKTDYKKMLNSADYWDDVAKLKTAGFIELKDKKVEITERGKGKNKRAEFRTSRGSKNIS